jgi:hypothetical protein
MRALKRREEKIILREGRVLELVDEHDGIRSTEGAKNMRSSSE